MRIMITAAALLLLVNVSLSAQPGMRPRAPGQPIPEESIHGERFALVIGITGYPGFPEGERLQYADDDARAFAAQLQKPISGGFPERNILLLTDRQATRSALFVAIDSLRRLVSSGDIVYFFFAGHGVISDEGGAYLMPYDADHEHPDALGIDPADLIGKLRQKLNYRNLVCFIDACHSGFAAGSAFTREGGANVVRPMKRAIIGDSATTSIGFFSCSSTQRSYEDPRTHHGLFTSFLLKGLDGMADRGTYGNADGTITARELYLYLAEEIPNASRDLSGGQTPEWTSNSPDFKLGQYDISEPLAQPEKRTKPKPWQRDSIRKEIQLRTSNEQRAREALQHGVAALWAGNAAAAAESCRTATKLMPTLDTAFVDLGVALMQLGKADEAVSEFRRAITLNSGNAYAHVALGAALLKLGNASGATVALLKARTLAPTFADTYLYLARARARTGDLEEAADDLDTFATRTTDPNSADEARREARETRAAAIFLREGRRLAQAELLDDAVREFYNMARLNRYADIAYYEIGRCRFHEGDFERAIENLRISARTYAKRADVHFLLGQAYERLGDTDHAVASYELYVTIIPEGESSTMVRGRINALKRERIDAGERGRGG